MINSKIRVLVDGAGGDVGQGVLKSLKDTSLNLELYAACISNSSSWLYKIDNAFIFPYANEEVFIEYLIDFINRYKIDIYFPTIDSSLIKIANYKTLIETKTEAKVFIETLKKVQVCDDKFMTMCFLRDNNFLYPKSIELGVRSTVEQFIQDNPFPLVLKTKSGNGAKEVKTVQSFEEVLPYINNSAWMLQEYLNTEHEITSGIYIGNDDEVKCVYVLKRELRCGSTYKAERVLDVQLDRKLIEIAKKMNMKYLNIQAVYENGKLYPFEFNGRMSGTTGAMRIVFNVAESFIEECVFQRNIAVSTNNQPMFLARYYEEVIYTQDDINRLEKRSHL